MNNAPLRWTLRAALAAGLAASSTLRAQDGAADPGAAATAEVVANIEAAPVGTWTIDDLRWPEGYLRRFAGRVLRESYAENFRQVVRDPDFPAPEPARVPQPRAKEPAPDSAIVIIRNEPDAARRALRDALPDGVPPARGFRAPVLGVEPGDWSFSQPADGSEAAASRIAMSRLAGDGLLMTTALAIESLGDQSAADEATLRRIGLPTDLLACFSLETEGIKGAGVIEWIGEQIRAGRSASDLRPTLQGAAFRWRPSLPGFIADSESGEAAIEKLRLQLTRGDDWLAPGDGGSIDILRQLVAAMPEVDFTVSIEPEFVDTFVDVGKQWPLQRDGRIVAVVEELEKITQWAQDNAKPGRVYGMTGDGVREVGPASLAPRYASLGELGSRYMQGDAFLLDGLALAGRRVVPSALLFQGGDLLTVVDPASGERIMLIGEAQVLRNTALGLTPEQALEAFRVEFGVDRCEVIPAVSFHLDFEVTIRAVDGRLIAFVNDSEAACKIILREGMQVMARTGSIEPDMVERTLTLIDEGGWNDLLLMVGGVRQFTHFPELFAQEFSAGPGDLGAGNLQRFLLALDIIASRVPVLPGEDPTEETLAYTASIAARDAEREALIGKLEALGMTVVRIPSLSDGERGVNYLNGLHEPGRYLMPAWGGLFAPLDEAAAASFTDALGEDIEIVAILSSESQRRNGAVRCSVEAHRALTDH